MELSLNHNNFNFKGTLYGKHKVPRYIYHLTNKANYISILQDGRLKTSTDALMGRGIFAVELTNLFKHWRNDKSWNNCSLQQKLIERILKGESDVVILRIPTENLNQDKLRVRSQNMLFDWTYSENGRNAFYEIKKQVRKNPKEKKAARKDILEAVRNFLNTNEPKSVAKHLTNGAPAKDSSLFEQRKQAIEYVYQDDIPIDSVVKIGEVDISDLSKSDEIDLKKPIKSIFSVLLRDTPEAKAVEFLDC